MKVRGADFVMYQVTDLDKSIGFYRDTLGMVLEGHWEDFAWAELAAAPTTLALWDPSKTTEVEAESGGAALALAVEDVNAAVEELQAAGVTVLAGTMDTPACYMAVIADPDGNRVILHQRKDGTWG